MGFGAITAVPRILAVPYPYCCRPASTRERFGPQGRVGRPISTPVVLAALRRWSG